MNDPDTCQHDFKRVFPRHVTGQAKTGAEAVLAVICCGCGKSPIFFEVIANSKNRPLTIRPTGDWPDHLLVTDYEWGHGSGPSLEFRER